jgi:predicted nucleic acid-binding protein
MRTVLVDSSVFLAFDDPAERSHSQTVATLQELVREDHFHQYGALRVWPPPLP